MNIDNFLNPLIIFWIELALCVSVVVVVLIGVFLAYRRLEYMERLLNKCSLVVFHSRFWDNSARGRMMRLSAITVAVLQPKRNLKRGVIDWQQVQEFPRSLKNLFRGIYFVIVVVFMCGVVFWLRK
ncbi:hypothetical protein [Pseudomonas sp. K5]|uniref:hypothetical protein n=1 Tax=Pseudomonas sp. K5 TaxID=1156313 RepID=UPI0018662C7A|nr:hypothetical protein [Pseudomonas sp. K5]